MKNDYITMGAQTMKMLRQSADNARQIQRKKLLDIIHKNTDTAYGKRFGFSEIHSLSDFQTRVPLSLYQDYEPYIEALLSGGKRQLTSEEPVYFAITSGSTGHPKYVPVTKSDMDIHYSFIHWGVYGMVRESFPQLSSESLFGKIFQTGEFAKTRLPSGQLCGIRSASLYQWLDRDGSFDASSYCVPKEVLFPEKVEDLTYIKVRFALAERNLTAIQAVFLHRVVGILDYIRNNWDLLLKDMAEGSVDESIPLSKAWREKMKLWLPPNPQRSAELRALRIDRQSEDMVRRIWPDMRYILGIGGKNFPVYTKAVEYYAGSIPIHHFIYGASEGFLSIAAGLGVADAYILLPDAGFFEFLPVPQESGAPLTIEQVEVGRRYELVFTNHSGLYRYRMQDVLEVVGFFAQTPVVRFCYRLNQALNVADEKLNTEQLRSAMESFQRQTGTSATFCVQEDYSVRPGRYLFYIEGPKQPGAEDLLDSCLQSASYGYKGCRAMGDIASPLIRALPPGCFQRYEAHLAQSGRIMAQYKPVQILKDEAEKSYFAAEADRFEKMGEI